MVRNRRGDESGDSRHRTTSGFTSDGDVDKFSECDTVRSQGAVDAVFASSGNAWDDGRSEDTWTPEWGGVSERDSGVFVELSNFGMRDKDLPPLLRHVGNILHNRDTGSEGDYFLNLDLSSNASITDDGVTRYLVPFLNKWSVCRRLKLFKTSIGDVALLALASWMAGGHAEELHLSDLGRKVTFGVVLRLLEKIQKEGRYPYTTGGHSVKCPLWVRLEHNGLADTEKLVSKAKGRGVLVDVVEKKDMQHYKPGVWKRLGSRQWGDQVPAMLLALFHNQDLRVTREKRPAARGSPIQGGSSVDSVQPGAASGASAGNANQTSESTTEPFSLAFDELMNGAREHQLMASKKHEEMDKIGSNRNNKDRKVDMYFIEEDDWNRNWDKHGWWKKLENALEIIAAIPSYGDTAAPDRWRVHLEYSNDPEHEASRILRLTTALSGQGFYINAPGSTPKLAPRGSPPGESEIIHPQLDPEKLLEHVQLSEPWNPTLYEATANLPELPEPPYPPSKYSAGSLPNDKHLLGILSQLKTKDDLAELGAVTVSKSRLLPDSSAGHRTNGIPHGGPDAGAGSGPDTCVSIGTGLAPTRKKGKNKISQ